jgi:predicted RNA-binding Zn-ribbon protein involved in translation (DUF1610 family)
MVANNQTLSGAQAGFGGQNLYGMGSINIPEINYPYGVNPLMQGGMAQGQVQAAMGNQTPMGRNQQLFICPTCNWRSYAQRDPTDDFPLCPNCGSNMALAGSMAGGVPAGTMTGQVNNPGNAAQAAFGLGQQTFICSNCNWRFKCNRVGNSFPNCPNCGLPMALDMPNANNGWPWGRGGQQAAIQPNFDQGVGAAEPFTCPNCSWKMNCQAGQNGCPRCPNCGQFMVRNGAYPQNQTMQANQQVAEFGGNAGAATGVGLHTPTPAPTIMMPHPSMRGICASCHPISGLPIGLGNPQGSTSPPPITMPHSSLRGLCANCHQLSSTPVGALSNQGSTRVRLGQQQNF